MKEHCCIIPGSTFLPFQIRLARFLKHHLGEVSMISAYRFHCARARENGVRVLNKGVAGLNSERWQKIEERQWNEDTVAH